VRQFGYIERFGYLQRLFRDARSTEHKFPEIVSLFALLSAANSSVPTGQIYVISDIGAFFGNLSREFEFH